MASRVLPCTRNPTPPPASWAPEKLVCLASYQGMTSSGFARCVRAANACTITLLPSHRVELPTRRSPRRSGGIGRRAWFRSMYPQGCGGSSPFFGTRNRRKNSGHPEFFLFLICCSAHTTKRGPVPTNWTASRVSSSARSAVPRKSFRQSRQASITSSGQVNLPS